MSGGWQTRIFASSRELARSAAETLRRRVSDAKREGRRASVALAGGSTPKTLYELLARAYTDRIDWEAVEVFFGDERCVPPDDPDSNFHMAHEEWLSRGRIPPDQVHRMPADEEDLEAAAMQYEEILRSRLPSSDDGFPILDLVWLGLGDDGHTASLFPGTAALEERSACVVAHEVPDIGWRMTLTYPVLDNARCVQFLVAGEAKSQLATQAIEESRLLQEEDIVAMPAARVRPKRGDLEWLLSKR
ncbi:MAG: 6-phosphogluconolactonase [Planctomycetota bacterium]|nr:6-phosphogluconolactonase [Planctomycetota bacterium]